MLVRDSHPRTALCRLRITLSDVKGLELRGRGLGRADRRGGSISSQMQTGRVIEQVIRCRDSGAESESHRAGCHSLATIFGDGDFTRLLFAGRLLTVILRHRHACVRARTCCGRRAFAIVRCADKIARAQVELKHQPKKD